MKNKSFWKLIIISVILLIVLRIITYYFISFDRIVELAQRFYGDYGSIILFIAGILEAIFIVGFYVPGSTTILLGGTLSSTDSVSFFQVIFWSTLGLALGYSISYLMGRYGGTRILKKSGFEDQIGTYKDKLSKNKIIYFWATVHPNIASLLAVAAGSLNINFLQFILMISIGQTIWSIFWGIVFYIFGLYLLKRIMILVLIVIIILLIYQLFKYYYKKRRKNN